MDYQGEVVDLKALRRLISENRKQQGYVLEESQRVCFGTARRRAIVLDLARTAAFTAGDFARGSPTTKPQWEGAL